MKAIPIAAIEIEPSGRLLVRPVNRNSFYEYIYREANGLRWDRDLAAFHAHEPSRWDHVELFVHLAAVIRSEFDEQFCVVEETTWVAVAPELERQLRDVLQPQAPLV